MCCIAHTLKTMHTPHIHHTYTHAPVLDGGVLGAHLGDLRGHGGEVLSRAHSDRVHSDRVHSDRGFMGTFR